MTATLPRPYRLGAPQQYAAWRSGQDELLGRALDSKKRFVALVLPTGSGKSLINVCAALITGWRAAVLTATRGLQDQYIDPAKGFPGLLTDVRGAANYPCLFRTYNPDAPKSMQPSDCGAGPCHDGWRCAGVRGGCHYFDAVRAARAAEIINTNYQYWMASHYYGDGLGKVELLMLDEAHSAPDELSRFLRINLGRHVTKRWCKEVPDFGTIGAWSRWAGHKLKELAIPSDDEVREGATAPPKELRELGKQLTALEGAAGKWVVDRTTHQGFNSFEPVWPAPYAQKILFCGAKKVIFTSATMRPKTLQLLGLSPSDFEFIEAPSVFPKKNRRVMIVPGGKINNRSTYAELKKWVAAIDAIIINRRDRKGIIHCVSYARGEFLWQHSKFRHLMVGLTPDGRHIKTTGALVESWKKSTRPSIMVSPALTTGYDFPGDECRYQIIAKIAFADGRDPVTKARSREDAKYGMYLAVIDLIQAAGRGNRSKDDWCETFIVDENAKWLLWHYRMFATKSFMESVEWRNGKAAVPMPPVVAYSKGPKVEHVLRAGQTRNHHCHWPGCKEQVPPAKWGCLSHWRRLPQGLRNGIWSAYTPGQEVSMTPSRQYVEVARRVQSWIQSQPNTRDSSAPTLYATSTSARTRSSRNSSKGGGRAPRKSA